MLTAIKSQMVARRRGVGGGVVALCLGLFACAHGGSNPSALDDEVEAVLLSLDRALSSKDLEGFSALIADDIVVMWPNWPAVVGKTAVLAFYRDLFDAGKLAIHYAPGETIANGRLVVLSGRVFGSLNGNRRVPFNNNYLYVLRRGTDGRLRFSRVVFSGAVPPPVPPIE